MTIRERVLPFALISGAVVLCGLYPLTAYAVDPLALPAILVALGLAALVVRSPEYGVAVAVALAPLVNTVVGGGGQPLQIVVPALAVATLAYGLLISSSSSLDWGRQTRLLLVAIAAFGVVALIASAGALEPSESLPKVLLIVTAAALFGAARQVCVDRRRQLVVLGGVLVGLLLASTQGVVQHFLGVFSTEGFVADFEVVGRVQGSFGHPNLYAGFLATLLPLALAVGLNKRFPPALRSLGYVAAAVAVPALYFTFARGSVIGLVVATIIWFGVMRPRLAIVIGAATVAIAIFALPATLKERFDPEASGSDVTLRSDIWKSALDIYADHPLLGVGVNNFGVAYERLPAVTDAGSQRRLLHQDLLLIPPHPQNMYLQSLAEQGIAGIITLLGLIGAALTVLVRAARSRDMLARTLGFSVGIGFTGILIHGLLEVPLLGEVMLPTFALLALTAGVLEGAGASDEDPEAHPQPA